MRIRAVLAQSIAAATGPVSATTGAAQPTERFGFFAPFRGGISHFNQIRLDQILFEFDSSIRRIN
jgi:hypothetical protein